MKVYRISKCVPNTVSWFTHSRTQAQCASEKWERPIDESGNKMCERLSYFAEIPWLDIVLHWSNAGWACVCVCVWAQTITIKLNECTLWRHTHSAIWRKDSRTKTNRKCLWRRCFLWFFSIFFFPLCPSILFGCRCRRSIFPFSTDYFFAIFSPSYILQSLCMNQCHSSLFSHFKNAFYLHFSFLPFHSCCRVNRRPKRWVNGNNTFGFR